MSNVLSIRQVTALIKAVGHKRTILVEGPAGSGKTSIHAALTRDPQFKDYYCPKPIDCTQLSDGSVYMPDIDRSRGISRELPNERFGVHEENHKGMVGAKPVLICLDEIAKTRQFVKDILAPIVYERRIGQYELPEGSIVFACTNLSEEGLGDSLAAHLRNRIVIVQMRNAAQKEWVNDFAIPFDLDPMLIATTEQYPQVFDSFTDYRAGGKYAGKNLKKDNPYIQDPSDAEQEQVVTPRSLHAASDIMKFRAGMDEATLTAALAGTLGRPFASHIMSIMRFGEHLPAFERVLDDPKGCPLPGNPTARIIQCYQFCTNVKDREQAEACSVYVGRMQGEMQALFVNTVAGSSKLANFALSATFALLLKQQRDFLA